MHRARSGVHARRLPAQHGVALAELALVDGGRVESAGSSRPLCAKNVSGLVQTIVSMSASAMPASRIAARVFGTLSGSLMPQSAALLTMMRSVPYFLTSATMRCSSIFVFG